MDNQEFKTAIRLSDEARGIAEITNLIKECMKHKHKICIVALGEVGIYPISNKVTKFILDNNENRLQEIHKEILAI